MPAFGTRVIGRGGRGKTSPLDVVGGGVVVEVDADGGGRVREV